jgi:RNA polymerase sigma-70 factor, ECF subfamily
MSAIDEGLVAAASAGDATATSALLEQLWPDAYRIAWSIAGERTAAEDAAQEACARVLRSLAGLRDAASLRPWFYRIVVNETKTRLRRSARAPSDTVDDLPAESGVSREEHLDLARALRALDPALRTVVVLYYYAGLNSAAIAQAVETTAVTVRWRLLVARRRLRAALADGAPSRFHATRTGEYVDEPQAVR